MRSDIPHLIEITDLLRQATRLTGELSHGESLERGVYRMCDSQIYLALYTLKNILKLKLTTVRNNEPEEPV